MNQLPKIRTQEDADREDLETWKSGSDRDKALLFLRAFSSSGGRLPVSDDHHKIVQDALKDFDGSNYSEARSSVISLGDLVEFYKDLAQGYLDELTRLGAVMDEWGGTSREPFVIMENGNQVIGSVEVIDFTGTDDTLYDYYLEPYLSLASDSEKEWIASRFADKIGGQNV